MSHCRGLSIGQWSPIYNVLFQLLLARLLDTNISQQFGLCKHFQQKDSNKCLFILILNKKTLLLNELNGVKHSTGEAFSVKRYVKWTDSL